MLHDLIILKDLSSLFFRISVAYVIYYAKIGPPTLFDADQLQTKIIQIIGVHKSTISRESSQNVVTRSHYALEVRVSLSGITSKY